MHKKLGVVAAMVGLIGSMGMRYAPPVERALYVPRKPRHIPRVVTASRTEIVEHNRNVSTRQVLRRNAGKGNRRAWIKAAGGIRQFKRIQRAHRTEA